MLVLGIESSCDETGAAVVLNGKTILSNVLASSIDLHEKYGGVFPELASRRHVEVIDHVIDEAIQKAEVLLEEIDLIAVTKGPGLVGSLLIGLNAAKGLSIALNKPLIGVNHIEAHLFASMMDLDTIPLPALGMCISGGHTFMVKILDVGSYEPIGTTMDDAIGEAFDKVAALLGLPYPGGPNVELLAREGNPMAYPLKAGHVKKNPLHFSFSGLKTSVLYKTKEPFRKEDLAASFQKTAFDDLIKKAKLASQSFDCKAIFFGGGVSNNQKLQEMMKEAFSDLDLYFPKKALALDNAAMIAALGAQKYLGVSDPLDLDVKTRIPIA